MKSKKKLKDIEPQFVIQPTNTTERIVAAAVRSTFRPKWTRTLEHEVRQQGIYTAYHDALALAGC